MKVEGYINCRELSCNKRCQVWIACTVASSSCKERRVQCRNSRPVRPCIQTVPKRLQLKTKTENNRMPSQDQLHQLMLVMKSKENVGPSLLYSRKRISSVFQIKTSQHAIYCVRTVVPGTCVKKTQHRYFWGQNTKWLGGWWGSCEGEVGEVRWAGVRWGREAGYWEGGR